MTNCTLAGKDPKTAPTQVNKRNFIEFSIIIAMIICGIAMAYMRIGDNVPAGLLFVGVFAFVWKIIQKITKAN